MRIRSVRIRSARIRSERIPSDRIRPVGAPARDMVLVAKAMFLGIGNHLGLFLEASD